MAPTDEQIAELDAIIAQLKARPEVHYQQQWFHYLGIKPPTVTAKLDCGTGCCIAGAAVARAGAQPEWINSGSNEWFAEYCTLPDGSTREILQYARELLGLSNKQAGNLFYAFNDMTDIENIRDDIVNNRNWEEDDE